MAYDREKILKDALAAIKKHNLTFFDEISLYVEPSRQSLYDWDFDKLDTIKEALLANKLTRKAKMRKKWEESENATLQIAAYRLMADDEEIGKLSTNVNKNEHTGKDGTPLMPTVIKIIEDNGTGG